MSDKSSKSSSSGRFNLKWQEYAKHLSSGIKNLGLHEKLTDVTLACEGQTRRAHKLLLSLTSPYFKNLFETHQNDLGNTIVIINHIRFKDLENILTFVYTGQVNVSQDELNDFLQSAEFLQIDGLTSTASERDPVDTTRSSSSAGSVNEDSIRPHSLYRSNTTTTTNTISQNLQTTGAKGNTNNGKSTKSSSKPCSSSNSSLENPNHHQQQQQKQSNLQNVKQESSLLARSPSPESQVNIRPLTEVIEIDEDENNISSCNNSDNAMINNNKRPDSQQDFRIVDDDAEEKEVDFSILDLKSESIQIFEVGESNDDDNSKIGEENVQEHEIYDSLGNVMSESTMGEEEQSGYYMEGETIVSSAPSTSQHFMEGRPRTRVSPSRPISSSSSGDQGRTGKLGHSSTRTESLVDLNRIKIEKMIQEANGGGVDLENDDDDEAHFLSSLELPTSSSYYSYNNNSGMSISTHPQQENTISMKRTSNNIRNFNSVTSSNSLITPSMRMMNVGGGGGGFNLNDHALSTNSTSSMRLRRNFQLGPRQHQHLYMNTHQVSSATFRTRNSAADNASVVCPICPQKRVFKNKNSLKVHKSLYHRPATTSFGRASLHRRKDLNLNANSSRNNSNNNNSSTNNGTSVLEKSCFMQTSQHF